MDKSKWPPGPWHDEPDYVKFETKAGYNAEIRRMPMGNLNGYVYLPAHHPMYGKGYDDIPVEVHGGLTYAGTLNGEWCFGFDTAHAWDLRPGELMYHPATSNYTYKDLAYVTEEVESLAMQLLKIQKGAK